MPEGPLLLPPKAAAVRIGIGRTTLYQLIASGEIASVKVGRARRIPEGALIEYVERLRKQAKAAA